MLTFFSCNPSSVFSFPYNSRECSILSSFFASPPSAAGSSCEAFGRSAVSTFSVFKISRCSTAAELVSSALFSSAACALGGSCCSSFYDFSSCKFDGFSSPSPVLLSFSSATDSLFGGCSCTASLGDSSYFGYALEDSGLSSGFTSSGGFFFSSTGLGVSGFC